MLESACVLLFSIVNVSDCKLQPLKQLTNTFILILHLSQFNYLVFGALILSTNGIS